MGCTPIRLSDSSEKLSSPCDTYLLLIGGGHGLSCAIKSIGVVILMCCSENSEKAGKLVDRIFEIFDKIVCGELGGEYISTGWIW